MLTYVVVSFFFKKSFAQKGYNKKAAAGCQNGEDSKKNIGNRLALEHAWFQFNPLALFCDDQFVFNSIRVRGKLVLGPIQK